MHVNDYAEIIALEGIQGALLQNYRNIFLASQSILFAVAAFIASQGASQGSYFCLLLFPIGFFLCVSWILIDRHRGLDELFFDCQLLKMEEGNEVSNVYNAYYEWSKLSLKKKRVKLNYCPRRRYNRKLCLRG